MSLRSTMTRPWFRFRVTALRPGSTSSYRPSYPEAANAISRRTVSWAPCREALAANSRSRGRPFVGYSGIVWLRECVSMKAQASRMAGTRVAVVLVALGNIGVGWASARLDAAEVTAASGQSLTLAVGSRAGVKVGMTGKICTTEMAGGRAVQACSAVFEVMSVAETTSTARMVKGNAAEVAPGDQVVFAKPLVPVRAPSAGEPAEREPASDDPMALLEAGTRALNGKDYVRAERFLSQLLRVVPDDPLAQKRLEEARAGVALTEATRRASEEARRAKAGEEEQRKASAKEIAYQRNALASAAASGDEDTERAYAKRLLDLEPTNVKAAAVRDREMAAAEREGAAAAKGGSSERVDAAWAGFERYWGGSGKAAERKSAQKDQARATRLEGLRAELTRARASGDREAQRRAAQAVLEYDSTSGTAEAVRAEDRHAAEMRGHTAAEKGDEAGVRQIWNEHDRLWPLDSAALNKREGQVAAATEAFRRARAVRIPAGSLVTYPYQRAVDTPFLRTAIAPKEAVLEAEVRVDKSGCQIDLAWKKMEPAVLFAGNITTYALWAVSRDGRPENLGEVPVRERKSGSRAFRTGKLNFAMFLTAEVVPGTVAPSQFVVFTSGAADPSSGARSQDFTIEYNAAFGELVRPGNPSIAELEYAGTSEPIELIQARKALELAVAVGAEEIAPKEMEAAKTQLAQATHSTSSQSATVDYSRRAVENAATAIRLIQQYRLEDSSAAARRK